MAAGGEPGKAMDLTGDALTSPSRVRERRYDAGPLEDSDRQRIAYILLSLLALVLVWALGTVTLRPGQEKSVLDLLQIVLSPLIALVSAVTGFYYGSKAQG